MAVTSYPGTVTPLRGMSAFTEAERDVFWGREEETAELASLVTGDTFRAGLLHGAVGVGKTSLLRAGLVPHLRDHGVVAMICSDNQRPAASIATAFTAATNKSPRENENPVAFLARVVSEAIRGQQFLFILDEIGQTLASGDDAVISEVADMYARVITRSGGRARFLFCSESAQIHQFGTLERRTGSLFPPLSRMCLEPFSADVASVVFERMVTISGLTTDPSVAHHVASQLNLGGVVSAAELQIAALAMSELRATNIAAIDGVGGPSGLTSAWLSHAAAATADERAALRLLAQFAQGKGQASLTSAWVAGRANVSQPAAESSLRALCEHSVLVEEQARDGESRFRLSHQTLAAPLRALAAPVQASAKRGFELLGSRAKSGGRLSVREWFEVKREGLEPSSPEERAVIDRTRRFAKIACGLAVAIPIAILIIIYISMSGRLYLDVDHDQGGNRVVVREGRPGLSMFNWLGFGDVVADTGLEQRAVNPERWSDITGEDITFDSDKLRPTSLSILDPTRAALLQYASNGDPSALAEIVPAGASDDQLAENLQVLALIARGGEEELATVEQAVTAGGAATRISALRLAAAVETRKSGSYREMLATALSKGEARERRLAVSVVRSLPDKLARSLWSAALERATDGEAKAELAARVVGTANHGANPSRLASLVINPSTDKANRTRAREALVRLASAKPVITVPALGDIASSDEAPEADRVWALRVLFDNTVVEAEGDLKSKIASLGSSANATLRAAALPLLARLSPAETAAELATMLTDATLPTPLRAAAALAWGEVAASDSVAASAALEKLIEDRKTEVRAAAARAMGKLGRRSQGALVELIKKEGDAVATGAAFGLVASVAAGGRTNTAVFGIATMWKKKGRAKRRAASAFAALAKVKPDSAASYLSAAAKDTDDSKLHAVGVEGLCNALASGGKRATRELLSVASSATATALRRRIAECAADHRDAHPRAAIRLAEKLLTDSDTSVRLEAVRILAAMTEVEDSKETVAAKLGVALADSSRAVRVVAANAIADLGSAAPSDIAEKLPAIFTRAEETEKLALLRAARAVNGTNLAPLALADSSDRVRVEGLRLALTNATGAETALQSALTDPSREVRQQTLEALAQGSDTLRGDIVLLGLNLATRDSSREIADRALLLLARVGDPSAVSERLEHMVASRSEQTRAAAARALGELASQDAKRSAELAVTLLKDPGHEVRAAAAISLGRALASLKSKEDLAAALSSNENNAMMRIATAAALVVKSESDREGILSTLKAIAENGPTFASILAKATHGVLEAEADALGFLAYLAP